MQKQNEKFTHVHADQEPCYTGEISNNGHWWEWGISFNGIEVAKGSATKKPEAMRNFTLAYNGFINSCGKTKIIIDPAQFAVEKIEKYNEE